MPALSIARSVSDSCGQVNGQLPPGINLVSADDLQTWIMDIKVMDANPIYQDQTYRLKFIFSGNYPIGDLLFFFVIFIARALIYTCMRHHLQRRVQPF